MNAINDTISNLTAERAVQRELARWAIEDFDSAKRAGDRDSMADANGRLVRVQRNIAQINEQIAIVEALLAEPRLYPGEGWDYPTERTTDAAPPF